MIDIQTNEFPPFLEEEFERMVIPGEEKGFAITYFTSRRKECTAYGLHGNIAICMSYFGDEYAVIRRTPIAAEDFESLYRSVPAELKRSGFLGAEDILDGDSYLVKWASDTERTRLVLCNPRDADDESLSRIAGQLDNLIKKMRRAKSIPEPVIRTQTLPLERTTLGDGAE